MLACRIALPLAFLVSLAACESAEDVLTHVVEVDVRSGCDPKLTVCNGGDIEFHHCGGDFRAVAPETRKLEVVSDLDPGDIVALVQLQHIGDYFPDGNGNLPQHRDFILDADEVASVVAAHDISRTLYRISASGEVDELDESLVAQEDGAFVFEYSAGDESPFIVTERHHPQPPRALAVKTSDPDSIMNSCCSATSPQSSMMLLGALAFALFVLGRRRSARGD